MKLVLILTTVMMTASAFATGPGTTGGGNPEEVDFVVTANKIVESLSYDVQMIDQKLGTTNLVSQLKDAVKATEVQCASQETLQEMRNLNKKAYFRESSAGGIFLDCAQYSNLKRSERFKLIVFHEYMRVLGLEKSDYKISSRMEEAQDTAYQQAMTKAILNSNLGSNVGTAYSSEKRRSAERTISELPEKFELRVDRDQVIYANQGRIALGESSQLADCSLSVNRENKDRTFRAGSYNVILRPAVRVQAKDLDVKLDFDLSSDARENFQISCRKKFAKTLSGFVSLMGLTDASNQFAFDGKLSSLNEAIGSAGFKIVP